MGTPNPPPGLGALRLPASILLLGGSCTCAAALSPAPSPALSPAPQLPSLLLPAAGGCWGCFRLGDGLTGAGGGCAHAGTHPGGLRCGEVSSGVQPSPRRSWGSFLRHSCGINALKIWGWGYGRCAGASRAPCSLPKPQGPRGGAGHPKSSGGEPAGGQNRVLPASEAIQRAGGRALGLGGSSSAGGRALQALVELVLEALRGGIEGVGQAGSEPQDVGHHADVLPQPGEGDSGLRATPGGCPECL